MAKAVGIGGVFLQFEGEEKAVLDWYEEQLGLSMTSYGTGFIEGEQLVLLSFKRNDNLNSPYINIRVDDIDSLINKFKSQGIEIISDIQEFPYGKFAQFKDPFTNVIELWEPYVEEYKNMVNKEVKDYKQKNKTDIY